MTATLYLHIGMSKTGSTALQRYLYNHRAQLGAADLAYSDHPYSNHSSLFDALFRQDTAFADRRLTQRGHSAFIAHREALRTALDNELATNAAAGRDVILSGEGASDFAREDVAALAAFAHRHFARVVVLALVRPPHAFVRSLTQQQVKMGAQLEAFVAQPRLARYRRAFEPYLATFGAANVRLGLYSAATLRDGCILQTLLAMMDRERPSLANARSERANRTISLTAAKLLSLLGESVREGRFSPAIPGPVRERLASGACGTHFARALSDPEAARALPPPIRSRINSLRGPKFLLPGETVRRIEAASVEDDAWICDLMGTDVRDYHLDAQEASFDVEAYRCFDDAEVAEMCSRLDAANAALDTPVDELMGREEDVRRTKMAAYLGALGR